MSKFWQKKYISKYTGKEIDEAIGKADSIPNVTAEDAGKVLGINESGAIVPVEGGGSDPDFVFAYTGKTIGKVVANVTTLKTSNIDLLNAKIASKEPINAVLIHYYNGLITGDEEYNTIYYNRGIYTRFTYVENANEFTITFLTNTSSTTWAQYIYHLESSTGRLTSIT